MVEDDFYGMLIFNGFIGEREVLRSRGRRGIRKVMLIEFIGESVKEEMLIK